MSSPVTAGDLLQLVRRGRATTRSDIGRLTGLSRTAVSARLDRLVQAGLLVDAGEAGSTGGRPAGTLRLRAEAGVVLAVAVGRSRSQLGVVDLAGTLLADAELPQEPGVAPSDLLPVLVRRARALLRSTGRRDGDVVAIGLSLPGTVDGDALVSRASPVLSGWDHKPLAPWFAVFREALIVLDNDANALAASERHAHGATYGDMIVVKASTGIGAGLVVGGAIARGGHGAAGDFGHAKVPAAAGRTCRCGETGCLEAVAGGWALVREMRAAGVEVGHVRDVAARALAGEPLARGMVHAAGRQMGDVLAVAINLLNPQAVVVGGDLAAAPDLLVAGIREGLEAGASAIATRELVVLPSTYGEHAGLVGCAAIALDAWLAPEAVDRRLRGSSA